MIWYGSLDHYTNPATHFGVYQEKYNEIEASYALFIPNRHVKAASQDIGAISRACWHFVIMVVPRVFSRAHILPRFELSLGKCKLQYSRTTVELSLYSPRKSAGALEKSRT